jgi:hypothetical protein
MVDYIIQRHIDGTASGGRQMPVKSVVVEARNSRNMPIRVRWLCLYDSRVDYLSAHAVCTGTPSNVGKLPQKRRGLCIINPLRALSISVMLSTD